MLAMKESHLRAIWPRERERHRDIKNRYWHVRDVEEKLSDAKCVTITNFSDT